MACGRFFKRKWRFSVGVQFEIFSFSIVKSHFESKENQITPFPHPTSKITKQKFRVKQAQLLFHFACMSLERKRGTKLVQSRRRNPLEEQDDGEAGPAIIDDSASEEANSDDDLQLSGSDNDDEEEEPSPSPQNLNPQQKKRQFKAK